MFYSTKKALVNQKREFKNQITGAIIANTAHETGNDTERIAARVVADAAIASTVTSLVNGGYIRTEPTLAHYSLERLRDAYNRSIA